MKIGTRMKEQLSLIGIFLSFNLILLSIFYVNYESLQNMNELGLFSILPTTYFIGLIMFFTFYIFLLKYSESNLLLIISTLILVIILFGTPTFIERTPRFGYTFRGGGIVDYIYRTGHLNTSYDEVDILAIYQNWPAIFIVGSFINQIAGISIIKILLLTPLLSQLFYFAPLYLIFSILSEKNVKKIFFALSIFYVANWVNQDYLTDQNIGLFLTLLTLALFLKYLYNLENKYKLLFIIAFSSVVIGHALSSIATFLYVTLYFLVATIFIRIFKREISIREILSNFTLVVIVLNIILIARSVYGVSNTLLLEGMIRILSIRFQNIFGHFKSAQSLTIKASAIQVFLLQLKIIYALTFLFMGIVGLIYYMHKIKFKLKFINERIVFCLCLLSGNFILYLSKLHGAETIIRMYIFSIIPSSYFIAQLLDNKRLTNLALIFLIVSAPIHILLHYANEPVYYYSHSEIKGINYFYHNSKQNSIVVGDKTLDVTKYCEKYIHLYLWKFFKKDKNDSLQEYKVGTPTYIIMSRAICEKIIKTHSKEEIEKYKNILLCSYDLIYNSGNFNLYVLP